MTDQILTQKDLELVADNETDAGKAAVDAAADDKGADKSADKGADKGADKAEKQGNENVFDGLDDDDGDADAAKGGAKDDKAAPDAKDDKAADAETKDAAADEKADAAWRNRVAERLLAPLKDQLSAAKLEKRQTQLLEQLKRYKSMDAAVIAGIQAQEKLRSGEHRKAPEGSDEEVAAWRKENGIPVTAEDIKIPNVAGKEWTDADQPMIDSFRTAAFASGISQAQINTLVEWNVKHQQQLEADYETGLKKADRADREACHDQLRTEYGVSEFKPNMAIMKRLMEDDEVFGPAKDELISARYFNAETGTWHRLTSNTSIARALIALATDRYGEGAMPSGDGRTTTTNRVAELEKLRDTDYHEYIRSGGADELMKIAQDAEARASKRSKR